MILQASLDRAVNEFAVSEQERIELKAKNVCIENQLAMEKEKVYVKLNVL